MRGIVAFAILVGAMFFLAAGNTAAFVLAVCLACVVSWGDKSNAHASRDDQLLEDLRASLRGARRTAQREHDEAVRLTQLLYRYSRYAENKN